MVEALVVEPDAFVTIIWASFFKPVIVAAASDSRNAICPAISYGCNVNGLRAAGPSLTRSVTRAISSSGPIAGW